MGELKKSFILYSDLIHTLEKMPDDKAGLLFKHILKYVNGEEPTTDDLIVELTFEPIKQQLKRDLKAWNEEVQNKSNGGKIGNLKRWHSDIYKQFIDKKITLEQALKIADNRIASHTDSNQSDTNRYQSLLSLLMIMIMIMILLMLLLMLMILIIRLIILLKNITHLILKIKCFYVVLKKI